MKTVSSLTVTISGLGLICWISLANNPGALAATTPSSANTEARTNAIPVSLFSIPAGPGEGKDPFFPKSARLWEVKRVDVATRTQPRVELVLNGLSLSGRKFAMVNGYTLAEGEETELSMPGGRVRVECISVNSNSATIKVAGEMRELRLKTD
jgi:hypothetical protein